MKHYTREELDRCRNKDMNFILRLICRIHLCVCPHCRRQMTDLQHDDALLTKLKDSLNMLKAEPNVATYQKICSTIHDLANKESLE
jgi:hypothetical protein